MKFPKFKVKIATDKVIIPLFNVSLVLAVGFFFEQGYLESIPSYVFLIGIALIVFITGINLHESKGIRKDLNHSLEEIYEAMDKEKVAFRVARPTEVRELICRFVPKAGRIRVIGTGRQNIIEDRSKYFKDVKTAYDEVEKRLGKTTQGRNAMETCVYERITTRDLKKKFKQHLKACLTNAKNKGHTASIAFVDHFDFAYTYFIVDDKFMVLNLENHNKKGKIDNIISLICTNPQIISLYARHFDRVYRKLYQIRSAEKLDRELDIISPITKTLKDLRSAINEVPDRSLALKHAKLEIEQTQQRVAGLRDNLLEIDHKIANGKMLNIFGIYMEELSGDFSYRTISFYEFWEDIMKTDEKKLFKINEKALQDGAEILRIFMINNDWIIKYYERGLQQLEWTNFIKTVKNHVDLDSRFNNYQFHLFFCSELQYHDYLKRYYNFGILNRDSSQEEILFIPNHSGARNRQSVSSTSLRYFYNGHSSKKNKRSNQYKLDEYEENLKEIQELHANQRQQRYSKIQLNFMEEVGYRLK